MRLFPKMSLLALACAAALTGCSSGTAGKAVSDGSGNAGGQSSAAGPGSSGGSAAVPTKDDLLGKEDLPAGAKVQELDIATMAKQLASLAGQAKIQPAECGKLATQAFDKLRQEGGLPKGVGMVALAQASSVSESIMLKPASFAIEQNEQLLKKCGTIRTTVGNQTTTAHTAVVQLPGVNADQVSAYTQEIAIPGAQQATLKTSAATMISKGRIITVSLSGAQGATPAQLAELANKALAKANG
jgi:hypothetical protein